MHHSDFVAAIASIYKPNLYLELGVFEGETWNKVTPFCERKIGVDVASKRLSGDIRTQTTKEFFSDFNENVDMVFIDADHNFESASLDFENSLSRLSPGGCILIHDTDPEADWLFDQTRCGDSYKIVSTLEQRSDLNIVTIPCVEAGLSLITRKSNTRTELRHSRI
tara:strand:- start:34990 stop:35487 length:498 start_codon:yes stop_codon:yes gene_type:complete